jgi:hypothetical protein
MELELNLPASAAAMRTDLSVAVAERAAAFAAHLRTLERTDQSLCSGDLTRNAGDGDERV